MAEAVEGGSSLAWRLLATLEGGSLVLATTALLVYTARRRLVRNQQRQGRPVHSVLITNTTNRLGKELKTRLESLGCTVCTVTDGATSGAGAGKVDALIIVGAQPRSVGLDGMATLVSEDVYENMKLLDNLSPRVHRGGHIAWACAGAMSGAFSVSAAAFDAALEASLRHVAKSCQCEPLWVGRCEKAEEAADRIIAALMTCNMHTVSRFSIRNTAIRVTGYIGRWLKIAS